MGYVRHNAIVITSWNDDHLLNAVERAKSLGLVVIGPSPRATNAYRSILVCPDGSNEGWEESNKCDVDRATFRDWLRQQVYEDGSSSLEWVEIKYGSDDGRATVVYSQWKKS